MSEAAATSRVMRFHAPSLALALALVACADRSISKLPPGQDLVEVKTLPVDLNRKIDILFVIDNSGSMREEQATLQRNFDEFINVLARVEGGLPDLHLGVVSTDTGCENNDVGDDGVLQITGITETVEADGDVIPTEAPCNVPAGQRFLQANAGADPTTLKQDFACIASRGTQGCGLEAPLEAMQRALTHPSNAGFVRDDAFLAVVFLGDEDDCSAGSSQLFTPTIPASEFGDRDSYRCFEYGVVCDGPEPRTEGTFANCVPLEDSPLIASVEGYVEFLRTFKDNVRDVIVAGITGPATPVAVGIQGSDESNPDWYKVEPSCSYGPKDAPQKAAPSIRLGSFLDAFPDRSVNATICDDDLSDGLIGIAETIRVAIGNPCLNEPLLDTNPDIAGDQFECSVAQVTDPDTAEEQRTVIPTCAAADGALPCWEFAPDEEQCGPDVDALVIRRAPGDAEMQPRGTVIEAACALAPPPAD